MKKNCWEIKNCGREPGGLRAAELGPCPAPLATTYDNVNGGLNAGRFCWPVAGTFCEGCIQGIFATKIDDCICCEVFEKVEQEEGSDFVLHSEEASFPGKNTNPPSTPET